MDWKTCGLKTVEYYSRGITIADVHVSDMQLPATAGLFGIGDK